MKQNLDTHLGDREEEQNLPSKIPPVPLPRDTSEGELDIFSGKSPVLAERKKLEPADPQVEPFTLESLPSEIQEICAQRRIKEMNVYIDKQYERYIAIHGEETIASKMSIIYSKVSGELAGIDLIESLPSSKLYNIFYDGAPPLPAVEVCNNRKYTKHPLTIFQKRQKPWVGMKVERRERVNFEKKYAFQLFDLTKNAVCILFLTEEGMTPKLENDAESLRQHNIPFILVGVKPGTSEQDGMKVGKNLGAVLFLEWNPEGDPENLQRLFSQVAMISKLSVEEQKRYRQDYWAELEGADPTYWVELEYQDFIRAGKDSVALIFELKNYITIYSNNPAEKVRDVVVSSTLFQRVVPASKKTVYTEDIKKNAAQKLINKLDFDITHTLGEKNRLDHAEQEPKFTIAEIDALVQGTLGNTVKNNLPVYNMLMLIRAKLVSEANSNEKEEVSRSRSVQPYSEEKTTAPVSTLALVAADSSEKEKDDNGLLIKFVQEGWPWEQAFHADDPLFRQAFNKWKIQKQCDDAEKNYQDFMKAEGPGYASAEPHKLAGELEGYIDSCNSKSAQQNRGSLISSTLFQYFTASDQPTDDTSKSAAQKLRSKLLLDQQTIEQAPKTFVNAPQPQFSTQEIDALCNSQYGLGKLIERYPAVRNMLVATRNKEASQAQQTQSAQPAEESGLFARFSRKG